MTKKKSLTFLAIIVAVLLFVGLITTTYAWFMYRYSEKYDFVLESDNHVVFVYETQLTFAPGTQQSTPANKILVAEANRTVGISAGALTPLDMFDTGAVKRSANAVKLTAEGAYWYGYATDRGQLNFSLSAKPQSDANYDLITYGELDYIVIFRYKNRDIMMFDGNYYVNTTTLTRTNGTTLDLSECDTITLPNTASTFGADGNDPWYLIPSDESIGEMVGEERVEIFNNEILLLPNTEFSYRLYVFAAKTDELVDPLWIGQTISLEATISVPEQSNP